ncbi:hypothetical protein EI94DRAFT_1807447 [Lactarius quietus]|nr:hypothetical protein EI94DRAFT_1807447 [Lactarius quietus]
MSLCHDLCSSCASASANTDLTDSNDFSFNFDDDLIIFRPARTFPVTPGTKKHLKTSCEDIAHQRGVDLDELHSFAESPTVLHMLVELKAHLLKVDTMLQTNHLNEVLESPVFKTGLQDWLAIAMVSPGIPAYVTGVTPRIMTIIRDQHCCVIT